MGGCVLRACSSRIPAPAWDHFDHEGYYLTTGNVILGCNEFRNNLIPTLYCILDTTCIIFDIIIPMNCNLGKPVMFSEEERPNQLQENSSGSLYGISITIPFIIKCSIIFLQNLTISS